ncbi:MAG: hypothetical protein KDK30_07185 [Leptospiraceae bacterium]|nr:hypothetical protein [Leptospiraceae bacterium]MCB1321078.1 hypothetical protein [Leptospiraceae bacterium]
MSALILAVPLLNGATVQQSNCRHNERVWSLISPGLCAQETDIRESLGEMPWYDKTQDSYHRYSPEEIDVPEKREQEIEQAAQQSPERDSNVNPGRGRSKERPESPGGPSLLSEYFIPVMLGIGAAIVLGLIIYLLYSILSERKKSRELLGQQMADASISHEALPENVTRATDIKGPLNARTLEDMIKDALRQGDFRLACIYMFLFTLLRLQVLGHVEVRRDRTAREYLRAVRTKFSTGAPFSLAFERVVRNFEEALYRGSLRDTTHIASEWERLEQTLPTD